MAPEVKGSITCTPGVAYELWSVPAFADGRPEIVDGEQVASAKRPVEPDDVLICKINPRINRVWQVGPARGRPQVASPEWITVRPGAVGSVEPAYLRHYLSSPSFRDWIVGEVSGVTGSHTRAKPAQVLSRLIPVPPVLEQRRIVDIVEDHLSRLDAAVSGMSTAQQRVVMLRAVAFSTLLSRGKACEGSTIVSLGSMSDIGTGTTPSRGTKAFYEGGTIPWITSGDLHQGVVTDVRQFVTKKALRETSLRLYPKGTLLLAMYGEGKTRGTCAELGVEATVNQACAAVQLKDQSTAPWVRAVLDAQYVGMRGMAAGGVQPNLNLRLVRSIEIPMPDLTTREQLLGELSAILDASRRLESATAPLRSRAGTLRRAVLSAAFAGKLSGRSADVEVIEELAGV
ncbi:restriction endonuclease subunit S [Pedococcus sp. 5OH_020]|uniref:restriction endonuclease subunit S n=1 Tax=Pedococcus sp. 5OH_020 TaxID=2989814 RepID=UPI0022E9D0B0|nr:restriction endonuclease subunit S [Pedococcus sp. 5OH_020]